MKEGGSAEAARDVRTLFSTGAVGGLTDRQLVERFADRDDPVSEAAFAALVERHGAMVWGVCRRVLNDPNDVADAFQATFLVLVRKARTLKVGDSLGGWLFGVSRRIAVRLRAAGARRITADDVALDSMESRRDVAADRAELRELVDAEIRRLPDPYRSVLVLCDLEGLTHEQAAHQLGCAVGTIGSRVARGRERLRARLSRRGAGPALVLAPWPSHPPPAETVTATLQTWAQATPGSIAQRTAAIRAQSLAHAFVREQMMTRLTTMLVSLAAAGLVMMAIRSFAQPRDDAGRKNDPAAAANAAVPPTGIVAKVVDPQGNPAQGVRLQAFGLRKTSTLSFTSDGAGRIHVPAERVGALRDLVVTAASADGSLGWISGSRRKGVPSGTVEDPWILTLLPRTRTVRGHVVDRAGKPLQGIELHVQSIANDVNGHAYLPMSVPESEPIAWPRPVTTDNRGAFRIELPEQTTALLVTRHSRFLGPPLRVPPDQEPAEPLILREGGKITGVIKDGATGKPVAGASVLAQLLEHRRPVVDGSSNHATSDAQGSFTITLTPGVYNLLFLKGPNGERSTANAVQFLRVAANRETRADLTMIEGRRIHGIVMDGESGKGKADVLVGYHGPARPRSGAAIINTRTDDHGWFELYVPPGDAYVYLQAHTTLSSSSRSQTLTVPETGEADSIHFITATSDEKKAAGLASAERSKAIHGAAATSKLIPNKPNTPGPQAGSRTLTGTVRDMTGNPLPGAWVASLQEQTIAVTDRDGVYVIDLPRRELRLSVQFRDFVPRNETVGADLTQASFRLSSMDSGR